MTEKVAAYVDARARKHPQESRIKILIRRYYATAPGVVHEYPQEISSITLDPGVPFNTNLRKLRSIANKILKEGHSVVHVFVQYTGLPNSEYPHTYHVSNDYTIWSSNKRLKRIADRWEKKGKENILFHGPTGPVTKKRLDEAKKKGGKKK
jgi:hypothetical protein